MNIEEIQLEMLNYEDGVIDPYCVGFAEHIAKMVRVKTLQEVKDALAKLQDKK